FQPGFRRQRIELFIRLFKPAATTHILDVGGFPSDWEGIVPIDSRITLVNPDRKPVDKPWPERYVEEIGDGCALRHTDKSFDIAYSNSVIEHLHTFENQKRFATEIRRVGKNLFVQTPNRWFPIEPHFVTAFVQYLPTRLARKLLPVFSFRGLFRSGDNIRLKTLAAELRLLSFREMKELFPDCEVHREKWFGLTKSFIAVRRMT
ncbi:MAG TPA: methyltransferase domain-containing protein, partial [Verrucomicrobiae bacterium]|nr:methyltransferase domain-containing protein [Verrucomicrobiae bacterium]